MNRLPLTAADHAALAFHPELARLIELRHEYGWSFQPVHRHGELELLTGARVWPQGWSDAIVIRDLGDAAAFRCDSDGDTVWQHDGCLVDVTNRLMELPAPGQPGAPRLVIATAPRLWTPATGLRR